MLFLRLLNNGDRLFLVYGEKLRSLWFRLVDGVRLLPFGVIDRFRDSFFGEWDRFRSVCLLLGGVERFRCDDVFEEDGFDCDGERLLRSVFDGPFEPFVESELFFGVSDRLCGFLGVNDCFTSGVKDLFRSLRFGEMLCRFTLRRGECDRFLDLLDVRVGFGGTSLRTGDRDFFLSALRLFIEDDLSFRDRFEAFSLDTIGDSA